MNFYFAPAMFYQGGLKCQKQPKQTKRPIVKTQTLKPKTNKKLKINDKVQLGLFTATIKEFYTLKGIKHVTVSIDGVDTNYNLELFNKLIDPKNKD